MRTIQTIGKVIEVQAVGEAILHKTYEEDPGRSPDRVIEAIKTINKRITQITTLKNIRTTTMKACRACARVKQYIMGPTVRLHFLLPTSLPRL